MGIGMLRRYHPDSAAVGAASEDVAPTHQELVDQAPTATDAGKQTHAQATPLTEGHTSSSADPTGNDESNNADTVDDANSDGPQTDPDDGLQDTPAGSQVGVTVGNDPAAVDATTQDDRPPRGGEGSGRDAWVAYAVAHGRTEAELEGKSRDEIADLFEQ